MNEVTWFFIGVFVYRAFEQLMYESNKINAQKQRERRKEKKWNTEK